MYCKHCGGELFESDTNCPLCGEPVEKEENNEEELVEIPEEPIVTLPEDEEIGERSEINNLGFKAWKVVLFILAVMILNTLLCYILFDNSDTIDYIKRTAAKTIIQTVTEYKYNFKNFDINIPDDYSFEEVDDYLQINNQNNVTKVFIEEAPYFSINGNKDRIESIYANLGYIIVTEFKEETYNNKPYFIGELNYDNNNIIVAYTPASETETFLIFIKDITNNFNYNTLESISTILNTVTYHNNIIEEELIVDIPRPNE